MSLVSEVREIVSSRELLGNLIQRELRSKYKGTLLGWGWSLINPLATTLIYTIVFSVVMKVTPPIGENGIQNYSLFLLCGLLPWGFFAGVVQAGQSVLIGQANLITKTYFPRRLLLLAHVGAAFVTFLIEMAVLVVIFGILGINAWRWIPIILVLMVLLAIFGLGIALALSVANVYFRDVAHFVGIAMQIWFYATPIIYPITLVTEHQSGSWIAQPWIIELYQLNPAISFIEPIRDMFYMGLWPNALHLALAAGWALIALLVGNLVFRRLEPRLAEEL